MAKKTSPNAITSLTQDWGNDTANNLPFSGQAVQDFIKKQFGSKVGYPRWVKDGDYYYLQGFATKEDADLYDKDSEANAALLLCNIQLPISTVQGDSYGAYLFASASASTDYVVSGDSFVIPMRFCAVRNSNGERLNYGEAGTLLIERSTDGGSTWNLVETRTAAIPSTDFTATAYTEIDLGSALATGSQKIRIRASYQYTGDDGVRRTATSTYVVIGNTINRTSISIALSTDQQPYTPIWASQLGDKGSRKFPLAYVCNGNVPKTFHYAIYDDTNTEIIHGTQTGVTINGSTLKLTVGNETDNANLFTHGVKTVLAYLTADDGMGGTIYSNGLVSRFMVVNEEDAVSKRVEQKKFFLLQQAIPSDKMSGLSDAARITYFDTFTNYTEGKLFDYAIFVPKKDENGNIIIDTDVKVPITFYLSNYVSGTWSPTADGVTLYVEQQEMVSASRSELYSFTPSVEIETTFSSLYAYLHVWFGETGKETDFMQPSFGVPSFSIPVDNSESYAPVSGATFLLNPRTRNNSEANPARILNAAKSNDEVESTFTGFDFQTDGWISDGSQRVLRIPSGRQVNIKQNPYSQFRINPKSSMLIELQFKISNVTNEDDPIFRIGSMVSGMFRGLRLYPLRGEQWVKSYGDHTSDIDFGWREGEVVRLAIAYSANVNPVKYGLKYETPDVHIPSTASQYYKDPANTTIGIVKIFVNGNKQREVHFNVEDLDEFTTTQGNGGIYIGMNGADIDIYSFRMYANKEFTDDDVLTNYISSLATTAEKKKLVSDNDIMSDEVGKGGKVVSIDKVQGKGKNTLLWHGQETSYLQDANLNGWLEIKKYDANGNFMPKFSGSLCRTTGIEILSGNISELNTGLKAKEFPFIKGQGSSAKTYWDWNQQFDLSKFSSRIKIPKSAFDSSITISNAKTLDDGNTVVEIYGGCLGADFPLGNTPKEYPIDADGNITVPDGWIDGNGILVGQKGTVWHSNGDEETVDGTGYYRGPCYQVATGTPYFQKGVWKINYASCQQSHLTGVNNIYNDIHTAIVGQNDLQKAAAANGQDVRVAKYTEPFFYFIKYDDNSDILYRGGATYGAGKMDKSTWGYAKKFKGLDGIKNFCMFEGSDNSLTLTDFRVPFTWKPQGTCPDEVTYSAGDDEGFGVTEGTGTDRKWSQCWDFDGGATYDEEDEAADPTHRTDFPKDEIVKLFADFANFIYLHNPAIKAYTQGDGTFESFKASEQAKDYYTKYWMTQGDDKYRLFRYSFGSGSWVDAGLWAQQSDGSWAWDKVLVNSSEPFKYAASQYAATYAAEPDKLNALLVKGVIDDFKARLPLYMDPKSLQVYYGLEVHFFCGTDNCGKNTYIVLTQFGRDVTITLPDGTKETHTGVNRFEMHSDDVDTTMAIDNNGRVTHNYDVDRMHPYNNDDTATAPTYSGMNNALFNLCEQTWDSATDNTMRTVMNSIFTEMCSLATDRDNILGFPYDKSQQASVLGALFKYIFYVESYFPARAYNEQGRIRYEYPETLGFITARQVRPIWQSQGSMDQYELEFMFRRIVYMISYAAWGPASKDSGKTGIPDADEGGLEMMGTSYPDGTQRVSIEITLTAHQTIYPTGNVSGAAGATIDPHVRVRAGEKYTLSLGSNTFENDTYFYVYLRNFYRSFGNLAGISISGRTSFVLNGIRLTEFILDVDPVTKYTDKQTGESIPAFRPSGFSIGTARNIEHLDIHGIKSIKGDVNLQRLSRLVDFNDEDTQVATVELPETRSLTTLKYSDTITGVSLPNQGGLTTLSAQGYGALNTLEFGHSTPDYAVVPFVVDCASNAAQELTIELDNVAWDESFIMSVLLWMLGKNFTGSGYVSVSLQLTASSVRAVTDKLGEDAFYPEAMDNGGLYVKSKGGNFLIGPDSVISGNAIDFKMIVIPKSTYTPTFALAAYDRTATVDGDTVYYKGSAAINARTGHMTTEEGISDSTVVVEGYYADGMHIDQSVTIIKTTYPQEIRQLNGATAIKATGDYEYTAVVYPAVYTGTAEFLWEITEGTTTGLTIVPDGNTCILRVTGSVPQKFNKLTLKLTVSCGNGSSFTKTKEIYYSVEQPILTAADNPVLMEAIFKAGWTASENYMLAAEAQAVSDLGETFKNNTKLEHFEQLQYFTGLTTIADNAFMGCTALEDVTLPTTVTAIGAHAYDGCIGLAAVSIPYVQTIGDYAFYGCTNVRDLVLGDALVSFGTEAFTDMQITEVSFGPNISNIAIDAFDNCQKLTTATMCDNKFLTWGMAFKNCRALKEYKLNKVEGVYSNLRVDSGILYRSDAQVIVAVPQAMADFSIDGYELADYACYWNVKTLGYTVYNPTSASCSLEQGEKGSLKRALAEYVAMMKPYVFDSKGSQMAEIKSATFVNNHNTMSSGTVTFKDGTVIDISTLNDKGCNFMIYRPKLYFKSYSNKNGQEILQFGGLLPIDDGQSFKEKYIGMFKAYLQNNVMKSQPNRIATALRIVEATQYAQAGGSAYGMWNYHDWCRENALHISWFGNTNYAVNIGALSNDDNGFICGNSLNILATDTHGLGLVYKQKVSSDDTIPCPVFFGLEGLGQGMYEFVGGYRHDATTQYIWDENVWSENHAADYTLPLTVTSSGYITQINGGEYFDMTPRVVNASSVTGWAAQCIINTVEIPLLVGGSNANEGGMAYSNNDADADRLRNDRGTRLAYYGHPTEVTGADFVASL